MHYKLHSYVTYKISKGKKIICNNIKKNLVILRINHDKADGNGT